MEFTSVEGIERGFDKLDTDRETMEQLYTTEITNIRESELLDVEKEYLGEILKESDDFSVLGVHNFDTGEFEISTISRYIATTYRYYDNDNFVSSDWVLPIEIYQSETKERLLVTPELLNGEVNTLRQIADKVFGEVTLKTAYFSEETKTVVFEVV